MTSILINTTKVKCVYSYNTGFVVGNVYTMQVWSDRKIVELTVPRMKGSYKWEISYDLTISWFDDWMNHQSAEFELVGEQPAYENPLLLSDTVLQACLSETSNKIHAKANAIQ